MSRFVVTAFLPFNGRDINSSLETVRKLKCKYKDDIIEIKELPVSWNKTQEDVIKIIDSSPDYIVLCGEAGGRKNVTIEKIAINLMNASIPDNDGIIKNCEAIDDGPDGYFSNVDVHSIAKRIGNDLRVSLSAGSYICNLSLYVALREVKKRCLKTKVIFVHFPSKCLKKHLIILEKILYSLKEE